MTLNKFQNEYCKGCGTQRCGGVYDIQFRDGCEYYQHIILKQPSICDYIKRRAAELIK